MKNTLLLALLVFVTGLSAQTVTWGRRAQPQPVKPANSAAVELAMNQVQTGLATFYADYLAGRKTAYNEVYQPDQLTAAHGVLPIGSILRVTRIDNGQSVDVRVNDSGGLCQGCIVTLSRAAADQIGLTTVGKAQVTVERTGFSNWNPRPRRMTSTATARGTVAPSTYEQRPVQTQSAYRQPVQQRNTAYGNTPAQRAATPPTYGNRPTASPQPRTIQNNRIGENAPDFGDAYSRPATVYPSVDDDARRNDPNAYRPATMTSKGGAVVAPAPAARRPLDTPVYGQPSVIDREVANSGYSVYGRPVEPTTTNSQPSTYSRPIAVPTPAEMAPVSEVQVAANTVKQGYAVQLASYGNAANAMRQVRALQARGVDNVYLASVPREDGSTLNRVLVGPFADMSTAQQSADGLKQSKQLTGIVIRLR